MACYVYGKGQHKRLPVMYSCVLSIHSVHYSNRCLFSSSLSEKLFFLCAPKPHIHMNSFAERRCDPRVLLRIVVRKLACLKSRTCVHLCGCSVLRNRNQTYWNKGGWGASVSWWVWVSWHWIWLQQKSLWDSRWIMFPGNWGVCWKLVLRLFIWM